MIEKVGSDYTTKNIACVNMDISMDSSKKVTSKKDLAGTWYAFDTNDLRNVDVNNPMSLITSVQFSFDVSFVDDPEEDIVQYFAKTDFIHTSPIDTTESWTETPDPVQGYKYDAVAKNEWINNPESVHGLKMKISSILRLKDSKNFGSLGRGLYYSKAFGTKFITDSKEAVVSTALKDHINSKTTYSTEFKDAYVTFDYYDHKESKMKHDGYASSLNGDLSSTFSDYMSAFTGTNYSETNAVHLRSLCGYKAILRNDEEGEFDHAEFKFLPREISIYPKSFEAKDSITNYLDRWNSDEILTLDDGTGEKEFTKAQRDDLTYSDTISLIVAVIDTFINAITIALVVFTSLSLVVSCFMIAVITYISVVERIKEIGVIRSLGGRKGDVASLFIVETIMTGLFSGVFGIVMTYILQIIVNAILLAKFGLAIMNLTIWTALMMIGISVVLSVLSGLVPSQSAAHKDPVVALRSNE